jgi:hypothetical protein
MQDPLRVTSDRENEKQNDCDIALGKLKQPPNQFFTEEQDT